MSNYVKNYDIGSVRLDAPYTYYIYELPLLSFGDIKHTINLSLVFNSRLAMENPFYISNGYKLNLQKRLIIENNIPVSYEDGYGSRIALINQGDDRYTFDDDSQRIIRKIDNTFKVENPDYSTETYGTSGHFLNMFDKYGELYISFIYSSGKVATIIYRMTKVINISYNNLGNIGEIEYKSGGESICRTTINYNGTSNIVVSHYSGVTYHTSYSTNGAFTAYSADGSAYSNYSHKIICTKATNSMVFERLIGTKTIDRTTYSFVNMPQTDKFDLLDITDFNGIKTRAQFVNGKLAYSYEINQSVFPEDENGSSSFTFKENITIYSNNEIVGTQKYNDGIKMNYDSNRNWWSYNLYDPNAKITDYIVVSGWIKKLTNQTISGETGPCTIILSDFTMPSSLHFQLGDLPLGEWVYFSIRTKNTRSPDEGFSCPMVETNYNDNQALMADFRIIPQHLSDLPAGRNSHITYIEDVLIASDGSVKVIDSSLKFYIGNGSNAEAINYSTHPITSSDILRYQINQIKGNNTEEIYFNNCRGVRVENEPLTVQINNTKTNVTSFSVGKRYYKGSKCFLTKNTVSSGAVLLTVTSYVDNGEYSIMKYDSVLNLVLSVVDGINTEYEYKYDINNRGSELITSKKTAIYIVSSAEYDTDLTRLVSTTDEFGTVTTYTTDPVWGVITAAFLDDGTSVTDTFDGDMSTMLTRTFGSSTDESKVHTFTYSDTNPDYLGISDGTLNYGFNYSAGSLTGVSKNGTTIETHVLSNNDKTLNSYYPSSNNPIYTVEQKTDNYGRTTEITGLIRNTYDINPTYASGTGAYSTLGVDNGSGRLASTTDLVTGEITKYAYKKDNISNVGVFNFIGTKIKQSSIFYDAIDRITSSECDFVGVDITTKDSIEYLTAATAHNADNRIKQHRYILDGSTKASTTYTYDDYLKYLIKRVITIGGNTISKEYNYDNTRLCGISHTINGSYKHYYCWDADAQLRTTVEEDHVTNGYKNTYEYDSHGQLIRENNQPLDKTFIYCYDNIGNITSVKTYAFTTADTPSGTYMTDSYTYDKDRLTQYGYNNISYNSIGYPVSYEDREFVWTKGKLTRLYDNIGINSTSSSEDVRFTYNAYGQRTSKVYTYDPGENSSGDYKTGSATTYYYDNSGRLIREYITEFYYESNNQTYELIYLYDESGIIGVMYSRNGVPLQPYYYDRNHRGDVIAIYDTNGNKKAGYVYDAFGKCRIIYSDSSTQIAFINPIRYRGYYYDTETKLYYLNARYYNPEWRRFISPDDTAYLDPETPNGLNLYCYCGNDPINYCDPSGHLAVSLTSLGLILAGTFAVGFGSSLFVNAATNSWTLDSADFLQAGVDGLFAVGSTLLSLSGISMGLSIAIGGIMGWSQYALGSFIQGNERTIGGSLTAIGFGLIGGAISGAGANNISNIENHFLPVSDEGLTAIGAISKAWNRIGLGEISKKGLQGTLNLYGKTAFDAVLNARNATILMLFNQSVGKIIPFVVISTLWQGALTKVYNKLGWK